MNVGRITHRIWKETKLQPSRVRSSNLISCCLICLHFLCYILPTFTVVVTCGWGCQAKILERCTGLFFTLVQKYSRDQTTSFKFRFLYFAFNMCARHTYSLPDLAVIAWNINIHEGSRNVCLIDFSASHTRHSALHLMPMFYCGVPEYKHYQGSFYYPLNQSPSPHQPATQYNVQHHTYRTG